MNESKGRQAPEDPKMGRKNDEHKGRQTKGAKREEAKRTARAKLTPGTSRGDSKRPGRQKEPRGTPKSKQHAANEPKKGIAIDSNRENPRNSWARPAATSKYAKCDAALGRQTSETISDAERKRRHAGT